MRKTSLDLDHESTIISMLAVNDLPDAGPTSKNVRILKILAGCVALLLVIVVLQGGTAWQ